MRLARLWLLVRLRLVTRSLIPPILRLLIPRLLLQLHLQLLLWVRLILMEQPMLQRRLLPWSEMILARTAPPAAPPRLPAAQTQTGQFYGSDVPVGPHILPLLPQLQLSALTMTRMVTRTSIRPLCALTPTILLRILMTLTTTKVTTRLLIPLPPLLLLFPLHLLNLRTALPTLASSNAPSVSMAPRNRIFTTRSWFCWTPPSADCLLGG